MMSYFLYTINQSIEAKDVDLVEYSSSYCIIESIVEYPVFCYPQYFSYLVVEFLSFT